MRIALHREDSLRLRAAGLGSGNGL